MFAKSLLTIALVALSVSASPVQYAGTSEASLYERSLVPEFVGLDKRESRTQAAQRIALAKKRAAKKAKRALMIAEGEQLLKRAVADALAAEPVLSKRDLEARELSRRALRNVRCGNRDSVCARAALPSDLPANGKVVCSPVTRKCIIGCQDGFVLVSGVCVASAPTCGPNTCPTTPNGVYTCSGANVCTLACNTAEGYQLSGAGNTCISFQRDVDNCGAVGNSCAASYNGVGARTCTRGVCRLACPAGTSQRRTLTNGQLYCA